MRTSTVPDIASGHPHLLDPDATLLVPYGRRVRAVRAGRWVIDASEGWVAWLPGGPPVPRWAFRLEDVDRGWLTSLPEGSTKRVELALPDDVVAPVVVVIDPMVADAWFEEDEQVHVHPRDPFGRVEVRASSRQVVIRARGAVIARSTRLQLLYETGLPTRCYIPRIDVQPGTLVESETRTSCPYKGVAHHFHLELETGRIDDAAWSYPLPRFDLPQIVDHVCFYGGGDILIELERPGG